MMKWTRYLLLMPVLMVQALSSCSLIDEPEYDDGDDSVNVHLAFSVAQSAGTRMTNEVVQTNDNYRGLEILSMIPFTKKDKIVREDKPSLLIEFSNPQKFENESKRANHFGGFYLYQGYTVQRDIASFLVYGKAPESNYSKAQRGSLTADIPLRGTPAQIHFSPEPFVSTTSAPAGATSIAEALTNIAKAAYWSTSVNSKLQALYQNFIGQTNDGYNMVMAGSTANAQAHIDALRREVEELNFADGTIEQTIKTNILSAINSYPLPTDSYPSSLGLPDGAAALRWAKATVTSDYAFMVETQTTTMANISTITRYCYPAELYYYANSLIDTSDSESASSFYESYSDWNSLLTEKYEHRPGTITSNTRAVAIKEPLSYGVARLWLSQLETETVQGRLEDAYEEKVEVGTDKFPLIGVIIGNQHPVGFDFKPVTPKTDADVCFLYDSQVTNNCCLKSGTVNVDFSTLVLESYDNDVVTVILEFLNNGTQSFHGVNGIIYPDTKFYLVGQISPSEGTGSDDPDVQKRVFTQDHMTKVSMMVKSLKKAYNVLPDILGGRLELGVELTTNWIQATPAVVQLDN